MTYCEVLPHCFVILLLQSVLLLLLRTAMTYLFPLHLRFSTRRSSALALSYLVNALLVPPQQRSPRANIRTRTVRNCGMRSFGRDVCPTSRSARGGREGEHASRPRRPRRCRSIAVVGRHHFPSLSPPLPRSPIRLPVNKHLGNCPIQQSAEGRGREGAAKVGRAMQKLFFLHSSSV